MRLSVALCTFNGERYLLEQLESIARQTRQPDELVICDDVSDDKTASVIGCFAQQAKFKISFCENASRLGVTQNFARAFSLCSGDVIFACDQDDIWEADKLEIVESAFRDEPDVLLAFHDLEIVDRQGKFADRTQWQRLGFCADQQADINAGRLFARLLRFNVITGGAMAFRSSLRNRALPIPEVFMHDEWIGLIASAAGKVKAISRPLVRYRQHTDQAIGAATSNLVDQYRYARTTMDQKYFARMVERTTQLGARLRASAGALSDQSYLSLVDEKLSHVQARLRMREKTLVRWPLAIGEAFRGRYGRFGYGFKSFLQDLVL